MKKIPWGTVVVGGVCLLGGIPMALSSDESPLVAIGVSAFGLWLVCVWFALDERSPFSTRGRGLSIAISAVASIAFGAGYALYPGSVSDPSDPKPFLRACGVIAIVLFGVGGLYLARRIVQDERAVEARIEGLVVGSEILPWPNIIGVRIVPAGSFSYLHVETRGPVQGFRAASVRSRLQRLTRISGEDLSIALPFRSDPDELMRAIQLYVPPQQAPLGG
jgi:hypothetical protein